MSLNGQRRSFSVEEVRNATTFHGKIRLGRSSHCSSGRQSSIRSAGREQRSARLSASSGQNRLVEGTAPANRFARRRNCRKGRKDRPRRCGTLRRSNSLYGARRDRDARCVTPTGCEGCSEETVIAILFGPVVLDVRSLIGRGAEDTATARTPRRSPTIPSPAVCVALPVAGATQPGFTRPIGSNIERIRAAFDRLHWLRSPSSWISAAVA